jgi:hypothetical protein
LLTITAFFATLDYKFFEKLLLNGIDAKAEVRSDISALTRARQLGFQIASGKIENRAHEIGQGKLD